jgi:GT2 family glycosyltransferase
MGLSHILDLMKKGRDLQALACFHETYRTTERLAPRGLVLRARILARLGETAAALADMETALWLDGADPDIMLATCLIGQNDRPEETHDLAVRVMSSRDSSEKQRQSALRFLDPERLPLVLHASLTVVDRVTVVHGHAQSATIGPLEESDFQEALGGLQLKGAFCVALDHYLNKSSRISRAVTVETGPISRTLTLHPLLPQGGAPPGAGSRHTGAPWIIMPVHDGGKVLNRCLTSVIAELDRTPKARLLIIDDSSQKPKTRKVLDTAVQHKRVSVIQTPRNLGFVGAVNLGMQSIGPGPVLLLNSDTYLPRKTLSRLRAHLQQPDVGTVTPLSNNAGSFSVPKALSAYAMPSAKEIESLAKKAYKQNAKIGVDVFNGNGFAMLISEPCMKEVGFLSAEFQGGYYEEVDYCMRASEKGYRHLAAVDCFVGHEGATSFGSRKRALVSENRRHLARKYPFYQAAYERYALIDPLDSFRKNLVAKADWAPRKQKTKDTRPDAQGRGIAMRSAPIVPVSGILDTGEIAQIFRRFAMISKGAVKAAGQKLILDHGVRLQGNKEETFLLLKDSSGSLVDHLDLGLATPDVLEAFEGHVLKLLEESAHAL